MTMYRVAKKSCYGSRSLLQSALSSTRLLRKTSPLLGVALLMLILLGATTPLRAATIYYVAQNGSDGNDGKSTGAAWRHLTYATEQIAAGDTVIVGAGTYDEPYAIWCRQQGNPSLYTTWKAQDGTRPIIQARDYYGVFRVNGSYINIQGFEVTAPNAAGNDCGGISAEINSHHLNFTNNIVHDVPAGGIGGSGCDHVTVDNNTVYRCSFYSGYQTSGISFYEPKASDNDGGYHFIIRNNRSFSNENINANPASGQITDGNGIILDDFRWTQNSGTPYNKPVLVENNVCYNNGGRGIHVFFSDNVTVRNNSTYNNQRTSVLLGTGELSVFASTGTTYFNNIAYSRSGGRALYVQDADASTTFFNNVLYNGATYLNNYTGTLGTQINGNPQYVNPDGGDLHIGASSPARNAGTNNNAATTDFDGQNRPNEGTTDIGADEYYGTSPTPTPPPTQNGIEVQNASFDAEDYDTSSPSSWNSSNTGAAYTETYSGARSGARHLTHYSNAAYSAYTSQILRNVPSGLYTLRAWVRGGGQPNGGQCFIGAQGYGGADTHSPNIGAPYNWTQISVPNINVTNGQCEIYLWSSGQANQWVHLDDVTFVRQ